MENSFKATEDLLRGYRTNRDLKLMMTNPEQVCTILSASAIKNWEAVVPHLIESGLLIQDASITDLLGFFHSFESVVTASEFEKIRSDCCEHVSIIFDDVPCDEKDIRKQLENVLRQLVIEARGADKTKVISILEDCLYGATGVLCKESSEESGKLDAYAGFAGLTDMYIPFGHENYQGKTFLVGEAKFAIPRFPGQPWYEYSNALAAQVYGSIMGHNAPVAMIHIVEGIKIFYRVPADQQTNLFELRQYPPGQSVLPYSDIESITEILMHIARIGMRQFKPAGVDKRKEAMAALQKRRIDEFRSIALGPIIKKKPRTFLQDTAGFEDTEISFKSARTGQVVTFTSLDLVSRLGEEGVLELKEALIRGKKEALLAE